MTATVEYGPAFTLDPLFDAVLRDPTVRREVCTRLAVLEVNEEIATEAVDYVLPRIAPHLDDEARNYEWAELKWWITQREKARVQLGQPSDMSADHWEETCEARLDEHREALCGGAR